jgi:hypothetical protein
MSPYEHRFEPESDLAIAWIIERVSVRRRYEL